MAREGMLGVLLGSAALPAGGQSLQLKPLSPVASYHHLEQPRHSRDSLFAATHPENR